jgi:3-oxoacyl-[acyl-carrier protein] reductase
MLAGRLENKVAVITGSSSGIGASAAIVFAKQGASVVVNHSISEKNALRVSRKIRNSRGRSIIVRADISKAAEVHNMFETALKEFGRVDILINNAGVHTSQIDYETIDEKQWEENLNVNLKGAWYCAREAANIMRKQQSGSIINVSSITNLMGFGLNLPYACAKSGQVVLTKYFARLLTPKIRVNCIACGVVETRLTENMTTDRRKLLTDLTLLKRFASPEEIANVMLFLASDESSYITGQTIIADGGEFLISP